VSWFLLELNRIKPHVFSVILTYRYRIKDASSRRHLKRMARAVNFVWNYCGDVQEQSRKWGRRWPSAYDLMKLTSGTSADLDLQSETINSICKQFARSRDSFKRRPRWRGRKSLGWVPFGDDSLRVKAGAAVYRKRKYPLWFTRDLPGPIKCGSFNEDVRGRWYLNLVCEVDPDLGLAAAEAVGIDLGLKTLAALSDGTAIENPRHFKRYEVRLAVAQRASNKRRAKAIQAKIANARRHHLHEQSTKLARKFKTIVVGNVKSAPLKRTRMAKSVSDASWYEFRQMLRYKTAIRRGVFIETDERFSSQLCSACGSLPPSRPKGIAQLGVRSWVCDDCGAVHDRDHNAALNILRFGLDRQPPAVEIAA
jgi:putative transposase